MAFIEICGNIAAGKSSLCKSFKKFPINLIYEKPIDIPFLEKFYHNPKLYSFETEMAFLMQHYHFIKCSNYESSVCDYSLLQDLAYADVNLTGERHRIFCDVVRELWKEIGFPLSIIHLTCSEDVLLQRIAERNIETEKAIDINYLTALTQAIASRVKSVQTTVKIVSLNSEKIDFRNGIDHIPELTALVQNF